VKWVLPVSKTVSKVTGSDTGSTLQLTIDSKVHRPFFVDSLDKSDGDCLEAWLKQNDLSSIARRKRS
jgi:hypothetical protein